ncbi:unnamed protein product, partial [Closterium sp. NIES-54]
LLGAVSTMVGPEERSGKGAGGFGEAQAQGQPRDSAMAPVQPSLGPPRDEPRVFGLDKFSGDNFTEWSFRMENIFDHYDLLEVIEGTEKRPKNDPENSPWVRKSAQGYLLLGQALGSSQIRHIMSFQREPEKGPKAWATLKAVHAPATAAVAVVLERQMAALRIEEDEAVEEGVQKFFDLLTRLEGADLNYSELQKKTKLLAIFQESWSSLIINLNRDLLCLSLEDVKRAILQEDFRRRELASANGVGAASIGRGYGRGRGRGRGGGRFGSNNFNACRVSGGYDSDNKSYGRGRGRFDGECHYCHKSGHMWRDCYKLPDGWTPAQGQEGRGAGGGRGRGRGGRGSRGGGAASMKNGDNESESRDDRYPGQFFFVLTQAPAAPEKDESFEEPAAVGKVTLHSLDYWVIDSGATYSMTPRANLLTELELSPVKHVTSALGQRAEVNGMGKAIFKGADGKMVGLKNVLWVPILAANLISVWRLQKAGMGTSSKGAKTYTARLVTSKLGEHEESGTAAKKQHKGEENPKAAAEEEYGESMWGTIASAAFSNPTSATGECDWLTLHRRMGHVALPILQQLVKNEMVAGIRVKGEPDEVLGCPTCIQAKFTRYPFSSSEATAKAPLDKVMMDVVSPLKLGAAGAEYFLTIVDVYTRMTWVYVLSKKSDVVETRANRTITEMARGLLIEAGLPDYFWPDAVRSACVAKNRALNHVGVDNWVPYVEWIGRKPKVDMLRVFGCMCMALVPKHLRHNKLGAKAIWAVHLGMAQNNKGWLRWDPFTKKFLVSRDCKFMENLMYKDWKAENEAKIGMRFGEVKSHVGKAELTTLLQLTESQSVCPPSVGGELALDSDVLEDRQFELECLAATLPRFASMLLCPEGDQDPLDIPTPRSYAEAIACQYSSQWQTAMDAEMASRKSTGTYVVKVSPPWANIVDGMWIFRVKRPPGSPPAFKAHYVARGFSQRQGVDFFQNFSPTSKMTTLRGSIHEEIWLRRPPGFTGSFPTGTQWSLRRPVYGLRQVPQEWHDTLRTTLAALGFAPSSADPSLFLRSDTSLLPFYVLMYVDHLVFTTSDSEALALVKVELQERHTCSDLGDLRSYLGLQITRDRAWCTITLTQSHMVHQVLQRFGF